MVKINKNYYFSKKVIENNENCCKIQRYKYIQSEGLRMRKKIIAILLMIMLVAFTGCNSTQVSYWEKAKEAWAWQANDFKQTGEANLTLDGEKIDVNYTAEGYAESVGINGYVKMNVEIAMPASLTGDKAIKEKITLESYIIDGSVYMNKSYFEDVYKLTGQDVPSAFQKLDAAYIGIKETNDEILKMYQDMGILKGEKDKYDPQAMAAVYEELAKLIALDLPMTQNGDTYQVTLDSKALGGQIKKTMDKGVENIIPLNKVLNGAFGELGATEAELKEFQKEYASERDAIHAQIEQWLAASNPTIDVVTTFGKDQQEDNITLKASMPGMFDAKMVMKQVSKKAELREVKIPGKAVELTQEQLVKMLTPNTVRIEEEKGVLVDANSLGVPAKVINKDGQKYVPARTVLTALNIQIGHDKAKNYAYGVFDGKQVKISELTRQGVTYVSLSTLKKAGVQVVVSGTPGNTTIELSY